MKRVLFFCIAMLLFSSLTACGNKQALDSNTSVGLDIYRMCGIVKEITDENILIQICGNIYNGVPGYCYYEVDMTGKYSDIKKGDSVELLYMGNAKYVESNDETVTLKDITVVDIEIYDNDYIFEAEWIIAGNVIDEEGKIPESDDEQGCAYVFKPAGDALEGNFFVAYTGNDRLKYDLDRNVQVKYDPETMEVVEVTQ